MEDTHWEGYWQAQETRIVCLNPCFNGRYSLRAIRGFVAQEDGVLILVLMEDTHWGSASWWW